MSKIVHKILIFTKRRAGMTPEEFRNYYENHHAPLCVKYSTGVRRYMRRFLTPHRNPETGAAGELQFDVITELWFDDEAVFRATVEHLSTAIMPDEITADELQLFDRDKTRMATVVEYESALPR